MSLLLIRHYKITSDKGTDFYVIYIISLNIFPQTVSSIPRFFDSLQPVLSLHFPIYRVMQSLVQMTVNSRSSINL